MIRRLSFFVAASVACISMAPSFVAPAFAQNSADPLVVRQVDTRETDSVSLTVLRPSGSAIENLHVTENGTEVEAQVSPLSTAGTPIGVAYVIDNSSAAAGALEIVKASVLQAISTKEANESIALVTTNGTSAQVLLPFSTDSGALMNALGTLRPAGEHSMAPGIAAAVRLFKESPVLQPNMIVISGSDGLENVNAFTSAISDARTSGSTVFALATAGGGSPATRPTLNALVTSTGGSFMTSQDDTSFQDNLAAIAHALTSQMVVTYASSATDAMSISVSDGTNTATVNMGSGVLMRGAFVKATPAPTQPAASLFENPAIRVMIAALALLSAGLMVYGLATLAAAKSNALTDALSFYHDDLDGNDPKALAKLADSQIIRNAVLSTTKLADKRGILQKVELKLAQADLELNPGEAIFGALVALVIGSVLGLVIFGILGLLIAALSLSLLPMAVLSFKGNMRKRRFSRQLPATLDLLASTLRAGFSLPQGLQAISEEVAAPMKDEILLALNEERLGRGIADSLGDIAERVNSDDFEWVVMAIRIQHQIGGNLAELLTNVGKTIRAREQLRREVRALTAEGRLSSIILVGLPPSIGMMIYALNPSYINPMLHSTLGQMVMGAGVVSTIIGWFAMQQVIKIKV